MVFLSVGYLVIKMVLMAACWIPGNANCNSDEEVFVLHNMYLNLVYADGKRATSYIIEQNNFFYGFCIPRKTKLVAVKNTVDYIQGVSFIGSIGERLVTNEKWKCTEEERSADWYQPSFNDTGWANAYSQKPLWSSPLISKNARQISSMKNIPNRYFCRGKLEQLPDLDSSTRSVVAMRAGEDQRLVNHVIQSFAVDNVMLCLMHCLQFDECVSINFDEASQSCEINSRSSEEHPSDMAHDNGFHCYSVIRQ